VTVLELPRVVRSAQAPVRRPRRRLGNEANALTGVALAVYVVGAAVMIFHFDVIMEDALSRVANAEYVLYSRQPKLSAVGFVWTPLPSFAYLPFLWIKAIWPAAIARGFLANVGSAIAMALAVRVLHATLLDLRVRRAPRLAIVIVFAVQPLIFFFAINGMTEAMLVAFILMATRRLIAWVDSREVHNLVAAGLALGLGYLARYEVAAVGVAAMVLVAGVSWCSARHDRAMRRTVTLGDAALVGLPVVVAFVVWAATSWIVVGHPFEQFSSQYGNSALIRNAEQAGQAGAVTSSAPLFVPTQWMVVAPLLLPVGIAVLVRSIRRRDARPLVPLLLLGAVPLFEAIAYMAGSLFGFLRYQIVVVPLFALLVGFLFAPTLAPEGAVRPASASAAALLHRRARRWAASAVGGRPAVRVLLATGIAAGLMVSSTAVTGWAAMNRPDLASQEYGLFRPMVLSAVGRPVRSDLSGTWLGDREVAASLDRMHLPHSSVLLDSAAGFAVITASHDPKQLVVTSDTDFSGALIDPVGHRISYLLVCDRPVQIDQVAKMYAGRLGGPKGVPWATLATRFSELPGSAHQWSLWKVDLSYKIPAKPAVPIH